MFTPTRIEIIKAFGSKELSEGCYINYKFNPRLNKEGIYLGMVRFSSPLVCEAKSKNITGLISLAFNEKIEDSNHGEVIEILGHIPELFPDVARVAKKKGIHIEMLVNLFVFSKGQQYEIPYNPTLPLIDQDEQLTLIPLLSLLGLN